MTSFKFCRTQVAKSRIATTQIAEAFDVEENVAAGDYPWAPPLDGGFTVLELPSNKDPIASAAWIAKDCRCDQGYAYSES